MTESRRKVVQCEHLDDECAAWLARRVDLVQVDIDNESRLRAELADADGLLVRTYTQVNASLLAEASKLRVVGRAGVGLDNIDLAACREQNVPVVYTPDANTQAVVEYVWALVLDVTRPRIYMDRYVTPPTFHDYRKRYVGRQLDEQVLGVLGMGRIGRRVAATAHRLGMRVLYNDLLTRPQLKLSENDPSEFADKPMLWAEADVLTIHVDGRPDNRHLVDAAALRQLKPTCLLVNTSRGMVIDNDALAGWADAVASKGGLAVLDVHDPEPPDDAYPLLDKSNVKLLPHLASRTGRAMKNMSWVVRDVWRVLEGHKPKWPAW